jgi:hypothetical protein
MERLKAVLRLALALLASARDQTLFTIQQRIRVRFAGAVAYQSVAYIPVVSMNTYTQVC